MLPSAASEPLVDVRGIESYESADLQIRHAALGDEAAYVARRGAEMVGEGGDVDQARTGSRRWGHRCALA